MDMSAPGLTPLVDGVSGGPLDPCQGDVPALNAPHADLPHKSSSSTTSCNSKYSIDDEGFYHYRGRKRRKDDGSAESSSTLVEGFRSTHGLTVILKPVDPCQLITKINPLKLHEKLESIAPDGVLQVRPNPRLNLLALDTRNTESTKAFLAVTAIGPISVQAYEPCSSNLATGVIHGVPHDVSDQDLLVAIRATAPVKCVRRLGPSESVKLNFNTETAPAYIILGHTRYKVQRFDAKPLQCHNCFGFGHVKSTCRKSTCCSNCGGHHERKDCTTECPRCINCGKQHESSSTHCPSYKREQTIQQHKLQNKIDYPSARLAVTSGFGATSSQGLNAGFKPQDHISSTIEKMDVNTLPPSEQDLLHFPELPIKNTGSVLSQRPKAPTIPVQRHAPSTRPAAPHQDSNKGNAWQAPISSRRRTATGSRTQPHSHPQPQSQETSHSGSSSSLVGDILQMIGQTVKSLLSSSSSPFARAAVTVIDTIIPFIAMWFRSSSTE